MYFVSGSNEAIISQEMFDQAQQLRKTRKTESAPLHDIISRQIRCSCGARIRAKKINQKWYWCCYNHEERHECQITEDGILEPGAPDYERKLLMLQRKPRARYRINHISWWAQEMPSEEEYAEARKNLAKVDWAVDYVITHCAPTSIALMENRHNEADPLTDFLQEVKERAHYHYWLFGHYHDNRAIDEKHILLWEQIVQVI